MNESLIDVNKLYFSYINDRNEINVLYDINLEVKQGEFIAVVGHNGSGKSTFAKLCNAILTPTSGTIIVSGFDTSNEETIFEIRKNVGVVFQNPDNQIVATLVEEDVAFAPENLGIEQNEIIRRVDESLSAVGMYEYKDHAVYNLSGGQKQRVAIAGILAIKPKCIVFDEATAMLDPVGRKEVIEIMKKLNKENGTTIIHITHYMEEAAFADRIVVISNGKIIKNDSPKEVFADEYTLKKAHLLVPQVTQLINELSKNNFIKPKVVLNVDECVNVLENLLGG